MKSTPNLLVEAYRVPGKSSDEDGNNGAFRVPFGGAMLAVIASDGGGWDHVSVSLPGRCPTWDEMCHVKDLFFATDEWVMQLHPPRKDNINCHPYSLHLWRPQTERCQTDRALEQVLQPIPLPPWWMVGPRTKDDKGLREALAASEQFYKWWPQLR